jgi:DNA uptake protein ComE-like DNA-binding protein
MTRRLIATAVLAATLAACSSEKADTDSSDAAGTPTAGTPAGTANDSATATSSAARAAPAAPAAPGAAATAGALVDPNTATREQLVATPGMTAQAADAIVAGRPYTDMIAVDRALAKTLPDTGARKAVYAHVWKPIDLNKATEAEMLLIPGVGKRMAHEFDEYRPYTDMARFRREIGKYVDQAEVARLERYVQIR